MTERIEPGDLVMIWRGCRFCGTAVMLGRTFVAAEVLESLGGMRCCGKISAERTVLQVAGVNCGWPEYVLKKLRPLDEGEIVTTKEEITF